MTTVATKPMTITRATPHADLPDLLTVEEFAAAAGLARGTAYSLIRTGQIASVKFGVKVIRIPKGQLTGQHADQGHED